MCEVLGIYDVPGKTLVALPITDRSTRTLQPIVQDFCAPGSVGTTDEWSGYNFLAPAGYPHLVCCHKDGFKNPLTGAHTNNVERCWKPWKKHVRTHGPIRLRDIPIHLNEWVFCFNLKNAGASPRQVVDASFRTFC